MSRRQRPRVKSMLRTIVVCLLTTTLLSALPSVQAQQMKKVARVGFITSSSVNKIRIEAFEQGMRDLGYVMGKNIVIEYRSSEGKADRLPSLMAELLSLKPDVIVSAGATTTRAAKEATKTIPIIMAQDPDPVGNGFVTSLARPGRNITGLSSLSADLSGKRLELLKEILPKISRVTVLGTSTNTGNAQQLRGTEAAAEAFKMRVQYLDILDPKDIEIAFQAARKAQADAMIVLRGPVVISQPRQVVELAAKNKLPGIYPATEFADAGGLLVYAPNDDDLYRRAAYYVDKILKGAKPAEIPVEQPMKFDLVINLKTAKQIGLTIPPNVLARADRVIK
jgi:ABC-type uncharacterized transport system substrate-binding protein